jgi:Apea-like HEPN
VSRRIAAQLVIFLTKHVTSVLLTFEACIFQRGKASMIECPQSFVRFDAHVRRMLHQMQGEERKLRLLPSSLRPIVEQLEHCEEFTDFVDSLPEEWEADDAYEAVADTLRRSGYYHGVVRGKPLKDSWSPISARLLKQARTITVLYLLDRCWFPREQFEIAGYQVTRMSRGSLEACCPVPEVGQDFYLDEKFSDADFQWLADRWFFSTTSAGEAGVFEVRADRGQGDFHGGIRPGGTSKLIEVPEIEVSAGIIRDDWGSEDKPQLALHLVPALILSLYDTQFFDVNVILLSDPGWRLVRHKFVEPQYRSTGDLSLYKVTADRWSGFETFIKLTEAALKNLVSWRSFVTASKRYMTATFAPGDPLRPWDVEATLTYMGLNFENSAVRDLTGSEDFRERSDIEESALLQYVFALEALLTGDKGTSIRGALVSGAKFLAGRGDDERSHIHTIVTQAYDIRCDLVHGREPEDRIAPILRNLRRILQRVMVVTMSLAAEDYPEEVQYREVLRLLPTSETLQGQVARLCEKCFEIISDCSHISSLKQSEF